MNQFKRVNITTNTVVFARRITSSESEIFFRNLSTTGRLNTMNKSERSRIDFQFVFFVESLNKSFIIFVSRIEGFSDVRGNSSIRSDILYSGIK